MSTLEIDVHVDDVLFLQSPFISIPFLYRLI